MGQAVSTLMDVRPAIQSDKMQRYVYETFRSPIATLDGDGDGSAGTTGPNILITADNIFEFEGVGTMDSAVLTWNADLGLQLTSAMTSNNVGLEINTGCASGVGSTSGLRTKGSYTVGTDACYMSLNFTLADVSGTDLCAVGFRKTEANQTAADTLETYTDIAVLNVVSGDIKIMTILNNGTTTTTDTTQNWADTENHTLTVLVSKTGVVTYEIDGAAPTVTAAFTFDSGDVIIPFFRIQNDSDVANGTILKIWDSGLQSAGASA